jgi:hypothetical protein
MVGTGRMEGEWALVGASSATGFLPLFSSPKLWLPRAISSFPSVYLLLCPLCSVHFPPQRPQDGMGTSTDPEITSCQLLPHPKLGTSLWSSAHTTKSGLVFWPI